VKIYTVTDNEGYRTYYASRRAVDKHQARVNRNNRELGEEIYLEIDVDEIEISKKGILHYLNTRHSACG